MTPKEKKTLRRLVKHERRMAQIPGVSVLRECRDLAIRDSLTSFKEKIAGGRSLNNAARYLRGERLVYGRQYR